MRAAASRPPLRRGFVVALLVTAVACALVAGWPGPSVPVPDASSAAAVTSPRIATAAVADPVIDEPPSAPQAPWSAATADPFAFGPPPEARKPDPAPLPTFETPVAPPPPPAPRPAFRWLGEVVGPDGRRLVVVATGSETSVVTPGGVLPGGVVVESVDDDGVRLRLPATGEQWLVARAPTAVPAPR